MLKVIWRITLIARVISKIYPTKNYVCFHWMVITRNVLTNANRKFCSGSGWPSKMLMPEKQYLSYDAASESKITPCIKIDKPLVIYRFSGNVMQ